MRKFFGSKVVQANKSGPSSAPGSSSRRQATVQRSNLTRPQPTWWPASQREGLSIRPLTNEELKLRGEGSSDEKWWTVDYSKRYKSATKAFIRSVMAGGMHNASILLVYPLKPIQIRKHFGKYSGNCHGTQIRCSNCLRCTGIVKVSLSLHHSFQRLL